MSESANIKATMFGGPGAGDQLWLKEPHRTLESFGGTYVLKQYDVTGGFALYYWAGRKDESND